MSEKRASLHLYHDDTVKFEHEGKSYCLRIQNDDSPMNPRIDMDNITTMACWHGRYRLGDKIKASDEEEFWRDLVRNNVPNDEIIERVEAGALSGIRIENSEDGEDLVDIYESYSLSTVIGDSDDRECLKYSGINKTHAAYYLIDDLSIAHCMKLMEPYAEWLPLWLYDHSGITMSCGNRAYPYNDRWDSGCVGWIVMLKKICIAETLEYVLDENGEKIKEIHEHEGHPPTWSFKTRPLTDETWRKRAIEIMHNDVEFYDQYLTGDVYGYTLYKKNVSDGDDFSEWEECDSCFGFFGTDIFENGVSEYVPGLREAIDNGRYEKGKANERTLVYYEL